MNGRIIAIGDIHGCHLEFADLLAQINLTKDDQLILLGDLVNRGPDSTKVIDLARQNNAISLLGNHELRPLNYRRDGDKKIPVSYTHLDVYKRQALPALPRGFRLAQ